MQRVRNITSQQPVSSQSAAGIRQTGNNSIGIENWEQCDFNLKQRSIKITIRIERKGDKEKSEA